MVPSNVQPSARPPSGHRRRRPHTIRPERFGLPGRAGRRAGPPRREGTALRSGLEGREVDEVILGQVVPSVLRPNVAREVSLLPQFPRTIPAYTLNRACASSGSAVTNAADQIVLGHADVVMAGGVESLSDIPILHSQRFSRILVDASKAKTLGQRLGVFARVRPRDLVPVSPAIAEPSTGESMGQSAEKMAKENGISREEQDRIALMSHQRAAAATADGRLTAEIAPWFGGRDMDRSRDQRQRHPHRHLARGAGQAEAGVRPPLRLGHRRQFLAAHRRGGRRPAHGGGEGERARLPAAGLRPELRRRGGGPRLATPHGAGLRGAQGARARGHRRGRTWAWSRSTRPSPRRSLSNVQAWASKAWAERLGRPAPVGEVDWERTNVMGGSIAIGHPFGATGARIVTTLANEMRPARACSSGWSRSAPRAGWGSRWCWRGDSGQVSGVRCQGGASPHRHRTPAFTPVPSTSGTWQLTPGT